MIVVVIFVVDFGRKLTANVRLLKKESFGALPLDFLTIPIPRPPATYIEVQGTGERFHHQRDGMSWPQVSQHHTTSATNGFRSLDKEDDAGATDLPN